MFVSPVIGFKYNTNYNDYGSYNSANNVAYTNSQPLNRDIFVKTYQPAFTSTSAGKSLKKLYNIHDAIFDIVLLNEKEWSKVESYINSTPEAKKILSYLQHYTENMLPVEKVIFEDINSAIKSNPGLNFQDCMKMWYDKALIKLKLEEFDILDKIDQMSKSLTPETMLEVRKQVTHCRQVILDDDPMHPFKRKTVLESLGKIQPMPGEEEILFELKELAKDLPTSGTSKNAFIVKYASRGQNEIAKRLLRMSLLTIDHVYADSMGGENALYNFTGMSALANSLKGDEPLYRFVRRFPCAKENYLRYMNDIIGVINNGGLRGNETYPYEHAKWVKKQSKGLIKLDPVLMKYKYSKKEAKEMEEKYLAARQSKRMEYMA